MSGTATFDFSGRHVLITGGSNGIGRGVAAAFVAAGAKVTITGTRPRDAYEDPFEGLDYHQLRMEESPAIERLAEEIDTLDVLLNNAGAAGSGDRSESSPDWFDATVAVNLLAVNRVAHAFHPHLTASGGSIVNVASMYSYFGSALTPGYSASKGAVVQLTKSLALAWARNGIRVNAIAPGWIRSNLTQAAFEDEQFTKRQIVGRTALRRWGEPEDCAGAVLFLCSDAARYITGVTLNVDGGYSIA
jgi:NAD(P)-dependent dehydrogenase (short-subunit alcohol dehydrogenase family)